MTPIKLYEPASTDGYRTSGENIYFIDATAALKFSQDKHGNYSSNPFKHWAIQGLDGRFFFLKSEKPVSLVDSQQMKEDLVASAKAKLTKEEREALGLV